MSGDEKADREGRYDPGEKMRRLLAAHDREVAALRPPLLLPETSRVAAN